MQAGSQHAPTACAAPLRPGHRAGSFVLFRGGPACASACSIPASAGYPCSRKSAPGCRPRRSLCGRPAWVPYGPRRGGHPAARPRAGEIPARARRRHHRGGLQHRHRRGRADAARDDQPSADRRHGAGRQAGDRSHAQRQGRRARHRRHAAERALCRAARPVRRQHPGADTRLPGARGAGRGRRPRRAGRRAMLVERYVSAAGARPARTRWCSAARTSLPAAAHRGDRRARRFASSTPARRSRAAWRRSPRRSGPASARERCGVLDQRRPGDVVTAGAAKLWGRARGARPACPSNTAEAGVKKPGSDTRFSGNGGPAQRPVFTCGSASRACRAAATGRATGPAWLLMLRTALLVAAST
jgi:hypothetical protein